MQIVLQGGFATGRFAYRILGEQVEDARSVFLHQRGTALERVDRLRLVDGLTSFAFAQQHLVMEGVRHGDVMCVRLMCLRLT